MTASEHAIRGDHLPIPGTSLVGRERELREVRRLLQHRDSPVLTLTGPAGVGKTRIACSVAANLGARVADGAWIVSLASIGDPDDVPAAVARALGATEDADRSPLERCVASLASRQALLVIDNFEHVVAAAPFVSELVAACPDVRVLVTSRTRLHLSCERIYPVAPLRLPAASRASLAEMRRSPAVQLFVARVRMTRPEFALTPENAALVAMICRRLDGLPLALELAAAWLRALPLPTLLTRLEHCFALLTGGARDQPPRLRSMRDAVAWSYDLLTDEQRTVFRRLAVFANGFSLAAAETVVGSDAHGPGDLLGALASLVDASLVQRVGEPGDEPHYLMLHVIREFGREQLAASGESDATHDRLLAWYLARARVQGWRWGVPTAEEDGEWFAAWERELDNVRAVLAWALTHGEVECALELAGSLFLFWWARGHLQEGRSWLERGLATAGQVSPQVRALALDVLSAIAHRQDDNARAADLARAAQSLWAEAGDNEGLGHASYLLAIALYRQGDLGAAERWYQESLTLLRATGNETEAAEAVIGLAQIARDRGDLARAAALYEQALRWQTAAGVHWGAALSRYGYGTVAQAHGELDRARALYRESLHYWRRIGDDGSVAVCLEALASALCQAGVAAAAGRMLGAAQALREASNAPVPCNALASYGGLVRSVRDALGGEAFAASWLAGLRLSADEAVAEAIAPLSAYGHQRRVVEVSLTTNGPCLTPRQRDVLALMTAGHSDREIAAALFISRRTASEHVSGILRKLGARSRADAAAAAVRLGLA
jgi:non-specific serine/threonine protein kinase